MDVKSISFEGRKYNVTSKSRNASIVKVRKAKRNNQKEVKFETPGNYEIYVRPHAGNKPFLQELNNDVFQNNVTTSAESKKEDSKGTTEDNKDDFGLPENMSKGIDTLVDEGINEKNPAKRKKLKSILKSSFAIIYSIALISGSVLGTSKLKDKEDEVPNTTVVSFESSEEDLKKISDEYNIDEEIIKHINEIDEGDDYKDKNELTIPSVYDYLDKAADALIKKLYKDTDLNDSEVHTISEKTDAYINKSGIQKEIANMYVDDSYVYIQLKEFNENDDEGKTHKSAKYTDDFINELFDIKDGELRKYNTLHHDKDENGKTTFTVMAGTILQVPESSINTENISYKKYIDSEDK